MGLFFVPFFVLGLFFLVMIVRELIASAATYTWQALPCQIVESEVRETSDRRGPWFAYLRYEWSTGESVRSSRPFASYRDAVRYTRRWPAASPATCYVDPRDPAAALLERKGANLVFALFIPLPLLFVFIGAAGFYTVVFRVTPKPRVLHPANPVAGRRIVAALLILVGTVLSMVFLLGPVRHAIVSRSWRARECTILRSAARPHAGNNGAVTYSPAILYSYVVDDREHRSDTYSFFDSSAGGRTSALRIADRYRPGSIVTCYVNPADPDDAVLHREPSLVWLTGLVPFALIAAGWAIWHRGLGA